MAVGRIPPKTDVEDDAYGAGWNADTTHAPSQNAVYDQMELRAPKESPTFTTKITTPIIDLTGGQIAFPASQAATADANTLDDYEEGTYIITIAPETSGSVTLDSGKDTCAYTKIGRVVHVQGYLLIDSISSPVGELRFSLPFASANLTEFAGKSTGSIESSDLNCTMNYIVCSLGEGLAYFRVIEVVDDAASDPLTGANLASGEGFTFQLTYIAA